MELGEDKGHLWEWPGSPVVRTLPSLLEAQVRSLVGALRSHTPQCSQKRKTKACVILSAAQDARVRSPAPGGADVCGPSAGPPWGRSTEATAARPPGGPNPLGLLSPRRAGLESAGSPGQVRGERSLTGPRGPGLASTTGQLGTTQTTYVYLWGHFSLAGTPAGGSVPCLLGTAPFSPLCAPSWQTPRRAGPQSCRGALAAGGGRMPAQRPHPLQPGPRRGAAFGLKSVYGHTWKEPTGWPPSGEIVWGVAPLEGASADRMTFARRPFPAALQCRIK